MTTAPIARPLPALSAVLYRRAGRLGVPAPQPGVREGQPLAQLLKGLEQLGLVLSQRLFRALEALNDQQIEALGAELLPRALAEYGGHRRHVPLFKNFPSQTPKDTYAYYLQRLLVHRNRPAGTPCALDGDDRPWGLSRGPSVTPERACAYGMFNPAEFGGCPVCHRRVGPELERGREQRTLEDTRQALGNLKRLDLDLDPAATVLGELKVLLQRTTPLPPQDQDDLRVLLTAAGGEALTVLPEKVPVRETLALVLGTLLRQPEAQAAVLGLLDQQVRTATDLLRVLDAAAGGKASLLGPNRAAKLPRSLRRLMLARLEALEPQNLLEDLHRQPSRWKKMGEVLHPFEYAQRFPQVAVAFAALRETVPQADALGNLIQRAAATQTGLELQQDRPGGPRTGPRPALHSTELIQQLAMERAHQEITKVRLWGNFAKLHEQALKAAQDERQALLQPKFPASPRPPRLKFTGWAGAVEKAFAAGQLTPLLRLLGQRPGELGRRLDALLRLTVAQQPQRLPEVLSTVRAALPSLTAPMLLLLRSHLKARAQPWPTRLIFPKASAQSFALPDRRAVLPLEVTEPLSEAMTTELLRRAGQLPRFETALLDQRLQGLPIPFAERHTAKALVTLARGSTLPLPEGQFARLFVHWMEHPHQRVDLDLSVTFFDQDWGFKGQCDFTNLRFAKTGAVHSGDLTSAPAPLGASEFIDLDRAALGLAGVRYVVMSVQSYNGIPFEEMAEAFAGYMLREEAAGPVFDPRTVEQRYDLRGQEKVSLPLALDLQGNTLHWLDTVPKARAIGEVVGHRVAAYHDTLGRSARQVIESAALGARPSLWDLAMIHALARAETISIRQLDGRFVRYRPDAKPELSGPVLSGPVLSFMVQRDLLLPAGSESYSLRDSVLEEEPLAQNPFAEALRLLQHQHE